MLSMKNKINKNKVKKSICYVMKIYAENVIINVFNSKYIEAH